MRPHSVLSRHYVDEAERQSFVDNLFDRGAPHYDRICQLMSLGSGSRYREQVLRRVGLRPGMKVLDVAVGTGLVAAGAIAVSGDPASVVGLDPSWGMLSECREKLSMPLVRGLGQSLPFQDGCFDVVSIGYALRHVSDLSQAFAEFHRVLKPGGRVVVMEIARPRSRIAYRLSRLYFRQVVPLIALASTRSRDAKGMMEYYWDTIESCVDPETILNSLREVPFRAVECWSSGVLSNYVARKRDQ